MRAYKKEQPPVEFLQWRGNDQDWSEFIKDVICYQKVKVSLMAEQHYLCCYCEVGLTDENCHIEHYTPRNGCMGDTALTYEYTNLGCSCNGGMDKDRHCGHYKGCEYDTVQFINPSTEDSEKLFLYDADGGIGCSLGLKPEIQSRVNYMIKILHLDCPGLRNRRRNHAGLLIDMIQGMIDANAIDQIEELARPFLEPNDEGKLQPFFTLSKQLFSEHSEAV